MDKYEYQVCADQIKSLIKEHRFSEAMEIADTIDWRRVKSFSMLCTVSEIYKVTKHYSEARDILLLAYDRYPDRANVVYALCELAIKLDDITEAVEHYKEYVRLKPHDTNRYVLLYKIYDAQDVPLEEKISLLEEFKKAEYTEKWAYELALLYHKDGQETKCVETCDELVLWFGDGPFIHKALELKKQHAPLTREQQMKYDGVYDGPVITKGETEDTVHIYETQSMNAYANGASPFETAPIENVDAAASAPMQQSGYQPYPQQQPGYQDITVQPVSTDKFSTINLQEELAKNMEEFYASQKNDIAAPYYGTTSQLYEPSQEQFMMQINQAGQNPYGQPVQYNQDAQMMQYAQQPAYNQNSVPNMPQYVGQQQNMQQYQQQVQPVYEPQPQYGQSDYNQPYFAQPQTGQIPEYTNPTYPEQTYGQTNPNMVQMGYEQPAPEVSAPIPQPQYSDLQSEKVVEPVEEIPVQQSVETVENVAPQEIAEPEQSVPEQVNTEEEDTEDIHVATVPPVYREVSFVSPYTTSGSMYDGGSGVPKEYEDKLSEGLDGQITMSLPDEGNVQKQITGQIDISDFMKDWEEKKKNAEEQRKAKLKAKSIEQTSDIMSQLVGVIPGLENVTDQTDVKDSVVDDDKKEDSVVVTDGEVIRDDEKGVVTKTTISSPTFDRNGQVKRSESGAIINGPLKSSITGEIPDILPSAIAAAKGDVLPSGRRLTLEDEYGGNIAKIRKDDEELVKRLTGELPPIEDEPEEEEAESTVDYGETEDLVEIEAQDMTELEKEEQSESGITEEIELDANGEKISEIPSMEPIVPVANLVSAENDTEDEVEPEPETADNENTVEDDEVPSVKQEDERITYPYNVGDLGEVEELEGIDQPEGLDDMLKTRPLPVDEIEARQRYEVGMDDDDDSEEIDQPTVPEYVRRMDAKMEASSRRDFDDAERDIFGRYDGIEVLKAQIVDAIDDMSMEPRHGNVIVMGSELFGRKSLAIDIVRAIQMMDSSFSGKVAKISGEALNKKNIPVTLAKLCNGALIVENAGGLTPITVNSITDALNESEDPILIVFEDEREALEPLLNGCKETRTVFDARIIIEDFNNDDLVEYAKGYAREQEYSIDEMGVLALHTKIADMQTYDHIVSIDEVIEIIDNAIRHVDRKNMSHFMDVLLAKRYDEDDYIVLREKDFMF